MRKPRRLKKGATPAQVARKMEEIKRYKAWQANKKKVETVNSQLAKL